MKERSLIVGVLGKFFQLLSYFAAITLSLIIVFIVLQVLVRNISWLKLPIFWVSDIAIIFFIISSFIGASITSFENEHIAITFLQDRLPIIVRTILQLFVKIAVVITIIIIVYGSWMMRSFRTPVGGLFLNRGDVYLILASGFILVLLGEILSLYIQFYRKKNDKGRIQ